MKNSIRKGQPYTEEVESKLPIMPAQGTDTVAPMMTSVKRSGSISLLRGRAGSVRRKEGVKRASKANVHTSVLHGLEESWVPKVLPVEQDSMVSYAVTITANNAAEKPREKRRMLGRILHMKSHSRGQVVPEIVAARPSNAKPYTRSPQQHNNTENAAALRRVHSRSASALSFFRADGTIADFDDELRRNLWSNIQPAHQGQSKQELQRISPMSKYNPKQSDRVRPRQMSLDAIKQKETDRLPRPQLKIITQTSQITALSTDKALNNPLALSQLRPPRKSSLQDNSTLSKLEMIASKVGPLASSEDESTRPAELPVKTPSDQQPPEPPPKDTAKEYTTHPSSFKHGTKLDVAEIEPLDRFSVMFRDVLGVKEDTQSSMQASNALPSPRLRRPLQSTLATRRRAVPKTLHVMAVKSSSSNTGVANGSGKITEVKQVISVTVTPLLGPTSTQNSPTAGSVISAISPRAMVVETATMAVSVTHLLSADKKTAQMLENSLSTPSQRRSGLYAGPLGTPVLGQRQIRKKSVHKKRPTGFRSVANEKRRSRAIDVRYSGSIPAVPAIRERLVSQRTGHRQSMLVQAPENRHEQPKPTRLTPPQTQGEWASVDNSGSTGRRPSNTLRGTVGQPEMRALPRSEPHEALTIGAAVDVIQSSNGSKQPPSFGASSRTALLPLAMHPYDAAGGAGSTDGVDTVAAPAAAAAAAAAPAAAVVLTGAAALPKAETLSHDVQMLPAAQSDQAAVSGAGQKFTAEESIQRMMEKQRQQQEQLNALLMGTARRPSHTVAV